MIKIGDKVKIVNYDKVCTVLHINENQIVAKSDGIRFICDLDCVDYVLSNYNNDGYDFNDLYLKQIEIKRNNNKPKETNLDVFSKINKRLGDELTVSEVSSLKTGTFPDGLSKLEKRHVNSYAPKWLKENCIECGQCKSKCPYGLDTPALLKLNLEDYKNILSGKVTV